MEELSEKKLKNLIIHSYKNIPYYKRIFDKIKIIKKVYEGFEVDLTRFDKIPILTKEDIRKNRKDLISLDFKKRRWQPNSTGGSTGEPLDLMSEDIFSNWADATDKYYFRNILGYDEHSHKEVLVWGTDSNLFNKWAYVRRQVGNWLRNRKQCNAYFMYKKNMAKYVKVINDYKPTFIRGYATPLYTLAQFIEENKLKIHSPKLIVSTTTTLYDFMRKKIEEVFGTEVFDFYGSREVNGICGECKNHVMHNFIFKNKAEIIKINKEFGRIIVTNLDNYVMPFIRYDTGDLATIQKEKDNCDVPLPVMGRINGRTTDNFIRKNGDIVYGEFLTHMFYPKHVVNAIQIIQEDYERIRILFVEKETGFNVEQKNLITKKIQKVMGKSCNVIWEKVEKIPLTKSGKQLYTFSLLHKDKKRTEDGKQVI